MNKMYESNVNGDTYASSIRDNLGKGHYKSRSFINGDYPNHITQNKEDYDPNARSNELLNNYIQVDRRNYPSLNKFIKKKQISIEDQNNQNQKRNHSFNRLIDSEHKYLTRTHSTVDISSSLNNKNETKFLKASIEEIKAKIASVASKINSNEASMKEYDSELNELKKKKELIKIQLPNRISEKESYEEIYKYNIIKYSKCNNQKGIYYPSAMESPCSSENIVVSKNELTSINMQEFKEAVISILSDLLINSKYEIIYQNLIDSAITKTFNSLNSFMGLGRGDNFFLRLGKSLSDIYPILNLEILIILLKYSVKLNYIEKLISDEMDFLSSGYKSRKKEIKYNLAELNETFMALENQLSDLKDKENDLVSQFDLLADISDKNTMNSSNIFKDSCKKTSFLYEDEENEQSFGNKPVKNHSNNIAPQLLFRKKAFNTRVEDNFRDSNKNIKKYNRIEDLNDVNNSTLLHINNDTKSTFHRSASTTGSAFMKNDSSFSMIIEDKTNKSNVPKSPEKIKKHHRNKQLSFELQKKTDINKVDRYENRTNNFCSTHSQAQNNNRNLRNKYNCDSNKEKNYSFLSISNNDIDTKKDHYISLLNDTYCYFKFLSKSDPKFNPLSPYSNVPELLGYEKGFISYDQSIESLIITSCSNKQKKQRIRISSIQSTIVINLLKDIITIHKSYQAMLQEYSNKSTDVDAFILSPQFDNINLSNNDKIKAALCSFFSFSIGMSLNEKIELIFVSYNEFKVWLNSLGYLINNKN